MNIQAFSRQLLEEALTTGNITLANGTIKELKTNEILSVAKYIMSNGIVTEGAVDQESSNIPLELISADEDYT